MDLTAAGETCLFVGPCSQSLLQIFTCVAGDVILIKSGPKKNTIDLVKRNEPEAAAAASEASGAMTKISPLRQKIQFRMRRINEPLSLSLEATGGLWLWRQVSNRPYFLHSSSLDGLANLHDV